MGGRIRRSVQEALDGTPEVARAAGELHHLAIGPGGELEAEWLAAGLQLPDLPAMRQYRVDRTVAMLDRYGYDGVLVMDPMNIRYVSDTTNMQVWVMHNGARYAFVSADGHVSAAVAVVVSSSRDGDPGVAVDLIALQDRVGAVQIAPTAERQGQRGAPLRGQRPSGGPRGGARAHSSKGHT